MTIIAKNSMNKTAAVAIGLSALMVLGVTFASPRNAYAHTFSGDESASFLATVEVIKVHLDLAKKDFATNATLSAEHVEHAGEHLTNDTIKEITERNNRLGTELPASLKELQEALEEGNATAADVNEQVTSINNLLDETVTVRIENTQLSNSTVQGTMLADFVDEILESYSGAYGVEEVHEEEGSMNETLSTNDRTQTSAEINLTSEEGNHTMIVNMMDYESAQALAARAHELFDTKLKAMTTANATEAVTALDAGLKKLKQAIDDKAPLDDVDVIVNKDVHPNIQIAFNLQVIPEFPLPILAVIMGITSVVAYSRLKGRKLP
jgi:hypothetical protein